jgi:hypothetical protein
MCNDKFYYSRLHMSPIVCVHFEHAEGYVKPTSVNQHFRHNWDRSGIDLAGTPKTGRDLHRLAPVSEDASRAGRDGKRCEDANIEATEC